MAVGLCQVWRRSPLAPGGTNLQHRFQPLLTTFNAWVDVLMPLHAIPIMLIIVIVVVVVNLLLRLIIIVTGDCQLARQAAVVALPEWLQLTGLPQRVGSRSFPDRHVGPAYA